MEVREHINSFSKSGPKLRKYMQRKKEDYITES